MADPRARVLLLCGPSGSGKSHVAERCGLPVIHLDDFYRAVHDPDLPVLAGLDVPDWDDPRSWDGDAAVDALDRICREGRATVPIYDMASSLPTGVRDVHLGDATTVLAEGVFAVELVEALRDRGLLADAVVLVRPRWLTFVRRLRRDLAEERMAPLVLLRRGRMQLAVEHALVAAWAARGCRRIGPEELEALLSTMRAPAPPGS